MSRRAGGLQTEERTQQGRIGLKKETDYPLPDNETIVIYTL